MTSSRKMEWVATPPDAVIYSRAHMDWFLQQLLDHPGRWAVYRRHMPKNMASTYRQAHPEVEWRGTIDKDSDPKTWTIYARAPARENEAA